MLRCNSIPHIDLQLLHGPFQNPSCRICRDWQADPKVRKDTRAGSSAVPGTRAELGDPHASVQRHDNHSSATLTGIDTRPGPETNPACVGCWYPHRCPALQGKEWSSQQWCWDGTHPGADSPCLMPGARASSEWSSTEMGVFRNCSELGFHFILPSSITHRVKAS